MRLPCGQCQHCRLRRKREWAIRCMHEAQTSRSSAFITLTYRPEDLPDDGSVTLDEWQRFMKRLRKRLKRHKLRYLACGEYGEKFSRPHYHAALFSDRDLFPDREFLYRKNGFPLFTDQVLSEAWGLGFVTIGSVTFDSAAYVAGYLMKKITGEKADAHYTLSEPDPVTGEVDYRLPEFATMSKRPKGLGADWFEQYQDDVFPQDHVVMNGREWPVPRYYRKLLADKDPELAAELDKKRQEKAVDCMLSREELIAADRVLKASLKAKRGA